MSRDCKHGNLARSCEICEKDEIIDRLRVECEAWRSGRIVTYTGDLVVDRILLWNKTLDGFSLYDTIDAAVDALMGERGK